MKSFVLEPAELSFHLLKPDEVSMMNLIADWYAAEWKVPRSLMLERLPQIVSDPTQFQVIMQMNGVPVATAGLFHKVGLHDKVPRFKEFTNWLAMVYTVPEKRSRGLGALICTYVQEQALKIGVSELYLFTDTAERLYERLGWIALERVQMGERNVLVMKKELR